MRRIFEYVFLIFLAPVTVWAVPSAKDLLENAKNSTTPHCNTHHLIFTNTTVIQKPGQAPTTITRTTEIFKKKPKYFKMIVNDGGQTRVTISNGDGYVYVQNPTTGKYMPVKSPQDLDPFGQMNNTLDDFDQSSVEDKGDHHEITLRGGKMGKKMDHAVVHVDKQTHVVSHMEGQDVNGNKMLSMDATYQNINGTYHPKHMHTESHTNNYDVSSDMDVSTNDVDKPIDDSVFNIH